MLGQVKNIGNMSGQLCYYIQHQVLEVTWIFYIRAPLCDTPKDKETIQETRDISIKIAFLCAMNL